MTDVLRDSLHACSRKVGVILLAGCCSLVCWECATVPSYDYRAISDGCNCTEFRTSDRRNGVEYLFRGSYSMHDGILTTIDIRFTNHSDDTLSLELGSVRVSSRNIDYQYNNRFLPLPALAIPPRSSETVHLTGKSVQREDNWNQIAGEQLTVTLQGLRIQERVLPATAVVFIPENPKLTR